MPQYQTFPGAQGDSRSLDKLLALRLPVLDGRTFLDVGCNEGFFCGFARFAGATRSVGVDYSQASIDRARTRFPDCEFHCQDWNGLPEGPFDVILLASALHYADDQPALLHRLMELLSRDGVLVIELGLIASRKSEWVKVTRGIDERWFPSLSKLREILAPYASKWQGLSVAQAGDPVERHVMHVSHRRPVAYLLMKPPGYGKSSLASKLFVPAGIPVVRGDRQMKLLAGGEIDAPEALRECVAKDFSLWSIDQSIERVFEQGLGRELVASWLAASGDGDFALDGYVPAEQHDQVRQYLVDAGYLPVMLEWNWPGPPRLDERMLARKGKAFFRSMRKQPALPTRDDRQPAEDAPIKGYVDRVEVADGRLLIRGWAINADGQPPTALVVRIKGHIVTCTDFEVLSRPDVRKRLDTSHDRLGFRIDMDAGDAKRPVDLGNEFSVAPVGGRAFRMTPAVARSIAGDALEGRGHAR